MRIDMSFSHEDGYTPVAEVKFKLKTIEDCEKAIKLLQQQKHIFQISKGVK